MESQNNRQDISLDDESQKEEQAAMQSSQKEEFTSLKESFEGDQTNPQDEQVALCIAELSMWKDQCKRISAEFENFKKRTERDQVRWSEFAKESLLQDILPFVDTFDLALQQKAGTNCAGIEMVYQATLKLLQKNDVSVMMVDKHFDPEFHEAVMQVNSDKHLSGEIVEVLAKGFLLKDRVLRHAKVSVAL